MPHEKRGNCKKKRENLKGGGINKHKRRQTDMERER